jgi:hypothetical protein
MLQAAVSTGMKYDNAILRTFPNPYGPQHDETKSSLFRFAGKTLRKIDGDAPLHHSVIERFQAAEVLQYDLVKPYRPLNLRNHNQVRRFYLEQTALTEESERSRVV